MLGIMCIETIFESSRNCPCGCGQVFPVFTGRLRYGAEDEVTFKAAHLNHCESGPHLWLLLGSGPWFEGDARNCWVTLHVWVDDKNVKTSITDPTESPFWLERTDKERYLTRDEVLSQKGGKEWAIERRLDFEEHHKPTERFINELSAPNPALKGTRKKQRAP